MASAGTEIGKIHRAGVAHGDVTTSNMILSKDGSVYIVDLGLAKHIEDIEDMAVDIHLLIRVLESSHYLVKDELFKCFISGYREIVGDDLTRKILDKVSEIRMRGRYVEERKVRKTN
jgi:Mn2+-dependent serine/threonine protein kinase